jgi:hypothetical protein
MFTEQGAFLDGQETTVGPRQSARGSLLDPLDKDLKREG